MAEEEKKEEGNCCSSGKSCCCCAKAMIVIVLLLVGGVIGYFCGRCCGKNCPMMKGPASVQVEAPAPAK